MSGEEFTDVEVQLERWGSTDTPAPDGAFINRLDAQLRDLSQGRETGRERRPFWQPALLTMLAALLIGAGAFAVTRDAGQEVALVMGATSQTEIELPDGEVLVATEGLSLPDGTRISVGFDGSAVVNDVVLGAGVEARVENGELQILEARPEETQTPSTTRATTSDTTEGRPTTTGQRTSSTTTPVTSTPEPTASSTTRRSTAASSTVPPSTATPSTTAVTTTVPAPIVSLAWEESGGDRVLSWTYRGPETLAGWEVFVSSGDRSAALVVLRDPTVRSITIDALAAPATYYVVARTADGATLAESNRVEVP